jgi:hypothetical protein
MEENGMERRRKSSRGLGGRSREEGGRWDKEERARKGWNITGKEGRRDKER